MAMPDESMSDTAMQSSTSAFSARPLCLRREAQWRLSETRTHTAGRTPPAHASVLLVLLERADDLEKVHDVAEEDRRLEAQHGHARVRVRARVALDVDELGRVGHAPENRIVRPRQAHGEHQERRAQPDEKPVQHAEERRPEERRDQHEEVALALVPQALRRR